MIVQHIAGALGSETPEGNPYPGVTLFIDFLQQGSRHREASFFQGTTSLVIAGNPYLSGHRLVAMVRDGIDRLRRDGDTLEKVLVGDLRSLRSFWNPDGLRRAIAVITTLMRQARIPVVLFETTVLRQTQQIESAPELYTRAHLMETSQPEPYVVDFADIVVELIPMQFSGPTTPLARITDIRTGTRHAWDPFAEDEGVTPG